MWVLHREEEEEEEEEKEEEQGHRSEKETRTRGSAQSLWGDAGPRRQSRVCAHTTPTQAHPRESWTRFREGRDPGFGSLLCSLAMMVSGCAIKRIFFWFCACIYIYCIYTFLIIRKLKAELVYLLSLRYAPLDYFLKASIILAESQLYSSMCLWVTGANLVWASRKKNKQTFNLKNVKDIIGSKTIL